MQIRACIFIILAAVISLVSGLGCIKTVCKGRATNYRTCYLPEGQKNPNCGHYESTRWNGQILKAVDLYCVKDDEVVAPFDAVIGFYAPYGDGSRWDTGLKFKGLGQWRGYEVTIIHVTPKLTSGRVRKGQVVGNVIGALEFAEGTDRGSLSQEHSSNFIQVVMKRNGKVIDPTGHLFQCSCTGQICETNPTNGIIGDYKMTTDYTGFELECPDKMKLESGEEGTAGASTPTTPYIYAPIDGKAIGRFRTQRSEPGQGYPCEAEGVFITGTGTVWEDYEVKIFNVKFIDRPSYRPIKFGEKIAARLDCEGKINTIAVELRFKGKVVNFKDQLSAKNCTMPNAVQK